jgi:multidrug transporter EmrE-like cation transporter
MLTVESIIGIVAAALVTGVSNLLIRAGIERHGGFKPTGLADLAWQFFELLLQPLFAIGFVLYFVAALIWFRTIATAPLTVSYPLLVSLTFVTVTLGAVFIWSEPLTASKLIGLGLIIAGITLVSAGGSFS